MTETAPKRVFVDPATELGRDVSKRLFGKVREENGCAVWHGGVDGGGYGMIRVAGEANMVKVHRVAWMLATGKPIQAGLWVLHHCDNPPCVKTAADDRYPEGHLFLGTRTDNVRDMVAKGRDRDNRGELNPRARLTTAQVIEIRRRLSLGESPAALAKEHAVNSGTVYFILHGETWKGVGA